MLTAHNVTRLTAEADRTPFTASAQATAMVRQIVHAHCPVAIYKSGGWCNGSMPLCLLADELGQGPNDVRGGVYIERQRTWGRNPARRRQRRS